MEFEERQRRQAWDLVGLILYLGRPASPLELSELSKENITTDEIKALAGLQTAPIRLSGQGHLELVKEQVKSRFDACGRISKAKAPSLLKKRGLQDADKENVANRKRTTQILRSGEEFLPLPGPAAENKLVAEESNISTLSTLPVFSRYVVESEGSSGGYGTVYKVRRKTDGQIFAMKCPLGRTADSCVKNEIDMLHRFRGRNYIVQCESVVQDDKMRANIVMQYFTHDKPEVLKKEITVSQLRAFAFCLFKALACLHDQCVLHRDIKPSNFLFSRETNMGCLIDFNLASDLSRQGLLRKPLRSLGRAVDKNRLNVRQASETTVADNKGNKLCKRKRNLTVDERLPGEAGCSTSRAVCPEGSPAEVQDVANTPHPKKRGIQPRLGSFAGTKGYRAPEVLLRSMYQSTKVDVWSAGVTLLNLIIGRNIFPSGSADQSLRDIAKVRGVDEVVALAQEHGRPISEEILQVRCKGFSLQQLCMRISKKAEEVKQQWPSSVFDLVEKCLQVDPNKRIDADTALQHEFFNA